ncbi:ABC transporter, ATP-binding protein [Treponema socranskii subsp. socranskii VPI DR56BR1116 = ATCC 35536]|uniref:ABC transporter, ATP-binding protein n=1 Tax=Treponema socranskii subsp. socranskii VPI DR56BR1116 = ATCC 35536 TaxID=1125725 RepID=U1FI10_TRESO|nr:ABC transporter ATP-binding protein [Treponema socranskii]ERF59373.1 ABC transporter, ATP-binding protein [Treponema socranskii subsp. socranskii VPI DR56BR1116 = ATCC 35536]ERK01201.1 ABC transporter, ATP-binding protein [Treponema socranskii subsp. socranskii VPI DR56BR1116 = ATCC 35536]
MLQRFFALSDAGTRNLRSAITFGTIINLFLMVPLGLSLYVLRYFLARIMQQGFQVPNVWAVSAAALAIIVVLFILEKLKYGRMYNGAYEEAANVRISLAESLRKLPLSYFGRRDLSYLTSTLLNDVTLIEESLSHAVPELFGGVISILIAAALLAFLDWRMTIALFIFAFAGFFIIVAARSVLDKKAKQVFARKDLIYDSFQQMIDNIKVLKSSDKKAVYVQKLKDDITESTYVTLKAEAVGGAFIFGSAAIVRFGFPLVISYGAYLLAQGRIELLTYIVFLLVSCRIFDPLTTVFMMLGEFFLMMIAVERKQAIVNYPKQTGSESFKPNGYDIRYDNVSFSYNEPNGKDADSDTEENTVSGIDFTAKQGEITALVGHSGCGKSTIARLAARFWDASSGTVSVGGVDVSTVDPETLLAAFSIVFQDVVLFNDTVYNNILIGNRNATKEQVLAAAKAAQCDSFIEKLPQGYDTEIGENGYTLSGGERQRLSIARALLKDAPIILLDEATAALDPENETLIQHAIGTLIKGKTVIVIAHRLRTVENADKIIVLNNGMIAEIGTHAELMEKNGIYREMYRLQRESEQWSA